MSGEKDQRRQLRFPLTEDEEVLGQLANRRTEAQVEVADLSLGGAGLVIPNREVLSSPRELMFALQVPDHETAQTPIGLVHAHHAEQRDDPTRIVGVRFLAHKESFLRGLCRFLVQRFSQRADHPSFAEEHTAYKPVTDRQLIQRVLQRSCRRNQWMKVFLSTGRPVGLFRATALRAMRLAGPFEGDRSDLHQGARYLLTLPGVTTLSVFDSRLVGTQDDQVAFSLPEVLHLGGIRRLGRVMPCEDDAQIWLEFIHPQVPGKLIQKRALEVGLGGMSFYLDVEEDLLARGSVLESALLRLPDSTTISCRCIVRHTFRDVAGRFTCGIEFVGFHGTGRQAWVRSVLTRMNPQVVEASQVDLEETWDVLKRSGYLEEKSLERMVAMQRPFVETWRKLVNERQNGARCWYHRGTQRMAGTICVTRVYRKTWMVHHMAVDRDVPSRQKLLVLSDLGPRTVLQWIPAMDPKGYVIIYYDANKSFNRQPYHAFFQGIESPHEASLQQFKIHDFDVDSAFIPPVRPDLWLRDATEEERWTLSRALLDREGQLLFEALDYAPEQLLLSGRGGEERTGLVQRRILVAGRGKAMLGFALIERGFEGTNIFSLCTTCRMLPLGAASPAEHEALRDALFGGIVRHFEEQGCSSFLCLAQDGDLHPPGGAATQKDGVRAVIASAQIARWAQHLDDLWRLT